MGVNPAKRAFSHIKDLLAAGGVLNFSAMQRYQGSDAATFVPKLAQICAQLNIDPDALMYVMSHESGMNPQALDPGPDPESSAVGLIQFEPSTSRGLGTSNTALYNMNGTQQLDWVEAYFQQIENEYGPDSMPDVASVYLAVFYPYALTQGMDFKLGSEVSESYAATVARENPAFDIGNKGYILKSDIWAYIAKTATT